MDSLFPSRPQLIEVIKKLPREALPELANYLTYHQFKTESLEQEKSASSSDFLMSITGLGEAEENLSERSEDILAEEIDSLRGWGFDRKDES